MSLDKERLGEVLGASIEASAIGDCAIISDAQVDAILADIEAQGFCIMPHVATGKMLDAAERAWWGIEDNRERMKRAYAAMRAAS